MRAYPHISFGMLIITLLFGIWGKAIAWPLYLICMVVSVLPDIDAASSFISKLMPSATRFIERKFGGHRTISHSFVGWAIFGIVLSPLGVFGNWTWWAILMTAFGSHLILDAFTLSGVPLFFPHPIRAVVPRSPKWRFKVGSRAELVFFAVTLMLLFGVGLVVRVGGVYSVMWWSFADIQSVSKQYRQLDAQGYRAYAQVKGKFNTSQQSFAKTLEIVGAINQNTLAVFDADTETVYSVGRDERANIYPSFIRCVRGEPVSVIVKEVELRYEMLNNLRKHVPPSGLTFIKGVVKTTDPLILPRNPDTYETIQPGGNELVLDYARPHQLLQTDVAHTFVLTGNVFMRTIYPQDTRVAASETQDTQIQLAAMIPIGDTRETGPTQQAFSSQHTVPLYIAGIRDATDILIKEGDIIQTGTPIARRSRLEKELSLKIDRVQQKIAVLKDQTVDLSALHIAEVQLLEKQSDLQLKQEFLLATERMHRIGAVSETYRRREQQKVEKAEHALKQAQYRFDKAKAALESEKKQHNAELLQLTLQLEQMKDKGLVVTSPVRAQVLLIRAHVIHDGNITVSIKLLILVENAEPEKQASVRSPQPRELSSDYIYSEKHTPTRANFRARKWRKTMPDTRPFCMTCAIRMRCRKNGVSLVHPNDSVQSADLYECPQCHTQILSGYGRPIRAIGSDSPYAKRFSQRGDDEWIFFEHTPTSSKPIATPLSPGIASLLSALGDEEISSPAALALTEIASTVITAFIDAVNHLNTTVRHHAVAALGKIGQVDIVQALIRGFSDEDDAVCEVAALSLAQIGEPALPALTEALRDKDETVRFYAVFALAEMEGEQTIPFLRAALTDKAEPIREIARDALRAIDGPDAHSVPQTKPKQMERNEAVFIALETMRLYQQSYGQLYEKDRFAAPKTVEAATQRLTERTKSNGYDAT